MCEAERQLWCPVPHCDAFIFSLRQGVMGLYLYPFAKPTPNNQPQKIILIHTDHTFRCQNTLPCIRNSLIFLRWAFLKSMVILAVKIRQSRSYSSIVHLSLRHPLKNVICYMKEMWLFTVYLLHNLIAVFFVWDCFLPHHY